MAETSAPSAQTPIGEYALIGDCETAALVDRNGSIDWLCWPRFDSAACFAAILGDRSHGRWRIAPAAPYRVERRYRPDTLVVETTFTTDDGSVRLIDFMPPRGETSDIVRLVEGIEGRVRLRMELVLRFDYGRILPWVTRLDDGRVRAVAGPSMVLLQTPVETRGVDMTTVADFEVGPGEQVPFVLCHQASHLEPPAPVDGASLLAPTEAFWREWSDQCKYTGECGWAETARLARMPRRCRAR